MEAIYAFFDVNNTFFTFLNYPISYLEFAGTLLNLVCVILVARRNILTWPVGIVGVILFGVLFYQINLYADFFEQIYYFITGIVGWYMWTNARRDKEDDRVVITTNSLTINMMWVSGIAAVSIVTTWALSNIHLWLPGLFPEPASLPAIDATTTIMSFAAQYLMMKRKLENWILWILVDIVAVWLYWYKDLPFVSLLYAIFLVNAVYGLLEWKKATATTPVELIEELA